MLTHPWCKKSLLCRLLVQKSRCNSNPSSLRSNTAVHHFPLRDNLLPSELDSLPGHANSSRHVPRRKPERFGQDQLFFTVSCQKPHGKPTPFSAFIQGQMLTIPETQNNGRGVFNTPPPLFLMLDRQINYLISTLAPAASS